VRHETEPTPQDGAPPFRPGCHLVIPTYNDASRLEEFLPVLLEGLKETGLPGLITIADDGSSHGNGFRLRRIADDAWRRGYAVKVIHLGKNRGKGYAVRAGWETAREWDWLGFVDADGSVDGSEVARLIGVLGALDPKDGILIGERTASKDYPVTGLWSRFVLGRMFAALVELVAPTGVADTQCGCKFVRGRCYADIRTMLSVDRFAFDVELLWAARVRRWGVSKRPVKWVHRSGSSVRPAIDGLEMVRALVDIRVRLGRLDV